VASVYRAPMRSRRPDVDAGAAVVRALDEGVCGIGGRLSPPPYDLDEAVRRTAEVYDDRSARRLQRFVEVPDGAFVWTRDVDGLYLLGRLTGPWRYDHDPAAGLVDLVHVRDCAWLPSPVDEREVPAATRLTFRRGGRNFQQTHDGSVEAETQALWERRVS
jgi:hypothetical protein